MNAEATKKATGRGPIDWFAAIEEGGKKGASHKEIADFLHEVHDVSYWWAQEITVEYEKHVGRRVLGQTQDGLFRIGVSKTIPAPAHTVWECLQSPFGIGLVTASPDAGGPGTAAADPTDPGLADPRSLETLADEMPSGIRVGTTTFEAGSHVRMQWQKPGWSEHSILQIRVTPQGGAKATLSFHQEKLPSQK
jgi:hypothetical protein